MKVLHTSDIHLKEYNDDRWNAIISLLETAKKESIDLFVISGDLFDKDVNAEFLRQHLRYYFSDNSFDIIILPGNHDSNSFGNSDSGLYFGSDVSIIYDLSNPIEYNNVRVWGFPFEVISKEEILLRLDKIKDNITSDKINLLLYHGELTDAFFSKSEFGDEGEERYMPCKLSYFKDLNFNYILAGHFHTRFDIRKPNESSYFVYPGSPISLTRREKGLRKVNIFEIGEAPKEFVLDTPHYEEIIIEFDPFSEEDYLETLRGKINKLHLNARVILTVKGYINSKSLGMSETTLVKEIDEIVGTRNVERLFLLEDIEEIFEDELFLKFTRMLIEKGYNEEKKEQLRNLVIAAMRKLKE